MNVKSRTPAVTFGVVLGVLVGCVLLFLIWIGCDLIKAERDRFFPSSRVNRPAARTVQLLVLVAAGSLLCNLSAAEPDLLVCVDKTTGKILWSAANNYYEALTGAFAKSQGEHCLMQPLRRFDLFSLLRPTFDRRLPLGIDWKNRGKDNMK